MKKIIKIALVILVTASLFTACTGGSKEPELPTKERMQADLDAAGAFVSVADYINGNGYTQAVDEKELKITVQEITGTNLDDALFVISNAVISDRDWSGTAEVVATYELVDGEYQYRSYYWMGAVIEPVVSIDFNDPEFLDYLGEQVEIRYKTDEDEGTKFISGSAYISSDSVQEIEVLGKEAEGNRDEYEKYTIQVNFNDGLRLRGAISFEYLPWYSNIEYEGYTRWWCTSLTDFERVDNG